MEELPLELLAAIARFLPVREVVRLRLVCRSLSMAVPTLLPVGNYSSVADGFFPRLRLDTRRWLSGETGGMIGDWCAAGAVSVIVHGADQLTADALEAAGLRPEKVRHATVYPMVQGGKGSHIHGQTNRDDKGPGLVAALTSAIGIMATHLELGRRSRLQLTTLKLRFNMLGDTGASIVAAALLCNDTLRALDLGSNRIGGRGMEALATALTSNTALRSLNVECNDFGVRGAVALAACLEANTHLLLLNLHNISIPPRGVCALAAAVAGNPTLRLAGLNLNLTGLAAPAGEVLADMLAANTSLTSLHLSFNELRNTGVVALARGLAANSTLTELYLSNSDLSEGSALALAECLAQDNTALRVLDLTNNQLGDSGGAALARPLATNTALASLMLTGNSVGNWTALALARSLSTNTVLSKLCLGRNNIDDVGGKALAAALQANPASALRLLDLSVHKLGSASKQALTELQLEVAKDVDRPLQLISVRGVNKHNPIIIIDVRIQLFRVFQTPADRWWL